MNRKGDRALDTDTNQSRKSGCGCVGYIGLCGVIGVLLHLLFPSVGSQRPARRAICSNNLKSIAAALHMYHDRYGVFPPAHTVDRLGKPLHSWRTLILPYLDEKPLYEQVKLDEPWNSPHNKRVAEHNLLIYTCPATARGISYLAVTTTGSVFEGTTSRSTTDISDGTSNTIAVIEVTNGPSNWMQPVDFDDLELQRFLANGPPSNHTGGLNVALVDGSVRYLDTTVTRQRLRALLTRSGGEYISEGTW